MKGRVGISFLVAVVVCLSGCTADSDPSQRSNVSLIHYYTGDLSAGMAELAAATNRQNPKLNLIPTPLEHESFKSTIRIQLEGANPPDLFSYWAGARTKNLVDRGEVQSLDRLFQDKIPVDAFPAAVKQALSYNGEVYMVPLTRHYVGFFYNARIFREAGLAEPKTWNDFQNAIKTLRSKGIQPIALGAAQRWPAQFWFDYLLIRTAGYAFRQNLVEGRTRYTDPAVNQALSLWRELFRQGAINANAATKDWTDASLEVVQGKAGMTLMGTWLIGLFTEKGYKYPEDYGFFPFPQVGDNDDKTALGPIDGILLASKAKHSQNALVVLEAMASIEPQLSFNLAAGGIAPRNGIDPGRYPPLQREINELTLQSQHWAFNFDLATPPEQAEIGLQALLEFVQQPENLSPILTKWDRETRKLSP